MLRIESVQRGGEKKFYSEWRMGQPFPVIPRAQIVTGFEATDKEFDFIARMFPAWSPFDQKLGYWHGDVAKTILGTVKMIEEDDKTTSEAYRRGG